MNYMNRLIKFRAWDSDNEKMVTGDLFTARSIISRIKWIAVPNGTWDFEIERSFNGDLMQYTGLKDKNGKEIYEGDIVKLTYPVMPEWAEQKRVVEWLDNKCKFSICVGDAREVKEIIGNIYENKELLSGN